MGEEYELRPGVDRLQGLEFFRRLGYEETLALSEIVETIDVPAGGVVIMEGQIGVHLYIVESGAVEVFRGEGSERVSITRLGPGEHFGEMSLLLGELTTAGVSALEDSVLLAIGQEDFNRLLSDNDVLGAKVYRAFSLILAERLKRLTDEYVARQGGGKSA